MITNLETPIFRRPDREHLIAIHFSVPNTIPLSRLLEPDKPFVFHLMMLALCRLMASNGVLPQIERFGASGVLGNGIVLSPATNRGHALSLTQQLVADWCLSAFVEMALYDREEEIWRTVFPAVPPGRFDRWLTDEQFNARRQACAEVDAIIRALQ
jgi:hypothetical protein